MSGLYRIGARPSDRLRGSWAAKALREFRFCPCDVRDLSTIYHPNVPVRCTACACKFRIFLDKKMFLHLDCFT
jgi:hypothetical protein